MVGSVLGEPSLKADVGSELTAAVCKGTRSCVLSSL